MPDSSFSVEYDETSQTLDLGASGPRYFAEVIAGTSRTSSTVKSRMLSPRASTTTLPPTRKLFG